jgi:hypothetical protein
LTDVSLTECGFPDLQPNPKDKISKCSQFSIARTKVTEEQKRRNELYAGKPDDFRKSIKPKAKIRRKF